MFAGNFAPTGYLFCEGQLLAINQYTPLFALIGTTYGGDGIHNFGLPDLRGRNPIGFGLSSTPGDLGGAEYVSLSFNQMPAHTHGVAASSAAPDSGDPNDRLFATTGRATAIYSTGSATGTMPATMVSAAGGGQLIPMLAPGLAINFIIATQGTFPSF